MATNLQQIQDMIAFEMDGNASISTSVSEWGQRVSPINRAVFDWAESYEWRALLKVHNGLISTSTGNASYVLPSDFKKIDSAPRIMADGSNAFDYLIVSPSRNNQYVQSDHVANILGNDRDTKVMFIKGTTLSSGASVQFTYYASPASMVTAGSITECPDPNFLVQRSLYYIYKQREDGRFPEAKAESDKILARMIENENTLGLGESDRSIPNYYQTKHSYRWGRD